MTMQRKFATAVIAVVVGVIAAVVLVNMWRNNVKEIPAGYVGRILTPTGWQDKIYEAGQVDLGVKNHNGTYNTLVLLEATSTTVKEQFMSAVTSLDRQDHRVLTRNGTPLAVDVYVRAMAPDDPKERNNIFALVTPARSAGDPDVSVITIKMVYDRFASMDVRGKVRAAFAKYNGYEDVYSNYDDLNRKIEELVLDTFKANGVPLKLQNSQLSNVKPDESLWAAQNQSAAAQAKVSAINAIGAALRAYPEYLTFMKWETVKETGKSGMNTIIIDGNQNSPYTPSFAAAEVLRNQLAAPPNPQK
jgi:hypothetical protein